MPIPLRDFREPRFTRIRERYPMSYNRNDRFYRFADDPRGYKSGAFPTSGYNTCQNLTRPERVRVNKDDLSIKGCDK